MEDLQHLGEKEKRQWLIQQLKENWSLDEDDIKDGDCSDEAIVRGNSDIDFGTILELCNQLDWIGFEIGGAEIYIDLCANRKRREGGKSFWLPNPDEFSICGSILRIWFD